MRVLALDVGEKRIGLAVSDPEARVAVPLETVHRSTERADLAAIAAVVEREGVDLLLVGLPLSLDGGAGPQARIVQEFARRLAGAVSPPVELWDERLSTAEARARRPAASGRRRRARRDRRPRAELDSLAAAAFLQGYLDGRGAALRHEGRSPAGS